MTANAPALLLIALCASCALLGPSQRERYQRCVRLPADASEVPWRPLQLPPGCPRSSVFVIEGGDEPKLPPVAFPIRDEETFRAAFPCVGELAALPVDLQRERIEKLEGNSEVRPLWVAITGGQLLVKTSEGPWCKGITPQLLGTLIVVPAAAPPLNRSSCSTGSCEGPPRV